MKTDKFKLYQSKHNRCIHWQINVSGRIYNHCIALHKRYYKMFGKHLNVYKLMKHLAKHRVYKFSKSREIQGKVKTLTVKRNNLGELFILVVTDYVDNSFRVVTGKIAGFDYGLRTFLTVSDGTTIESPLFFNQARKKLKIASRKLASKKKS